MRKAGPITSPGWPRLQPGTSPARTLGTAALAQSEPSSHKEPNVLQLAAAGIIGLEFGQPVVGIWATSGAIGIKRNTTIAITQTRSSKPKEPSAMPKVPTADHRARHHFR